MNNKQDILEVLDSLREIAQRHKNAAKQTRHKAFRRRHEQDFLEMDKITTKLENALKEQ